jgi:hypothetical protein
MRRTIILLLCIAGSVLIVVSLSAFSTGLAGINQYKIVFSSHIGGDQYEESRDVTIDVAGNIYLVGGTQSGEPGSSVTYPTTLGVVQPEHNQAENPDGVANFDVFVTKLDSKGQIIWSTFLGGPCYDRAYAVEVDNRGYVYIAGRAGCDFPYISLNAFQPDFMEGGAGKYGRQDGFILKLSPDGTRVIWASYFGSTEGDYLRDLDISPGGEVYVIGNHAPKGRLSSGIAVGLASGYRGKPLGGVDAILAKISPDGTKVLWASFIGGSDDEYGSSSLRVGSDKNIYALTTTESKNAQTVNAYDPTFNGKSDAYLVKFTPDGKTLLFATYLGGSGGDFTANAHNLWLDKYNNCIISGDTTSKDYPVTTNAFQKIYHGAVSDEWEKAGDLFVSIISSDGKRLLASTYFGGKLGDRAPEGITLDQAGNVVISGLSYSSDLPVTIGGMKLVGESDHLLAIFSPDLSKLLYSTFTGGAGQRALDSYGNTIVASGASTSPSWRTVNPIQPYWGNTDASVFKLVVSSTP